jgi:hypothetical protein
MEISSKRYNEIKTNNYLKTNLFFLFNGLNRNSNDWILIEQNLKKINFKYYKIFNKISKLSIKKSIYKNFTITLNGITFIVLPIKVTKKLKHIELNKLELFLFNLLAVKLNNKIYSSIQVKNLNCLNYYENKLLFYQYRITNLKIYLL